MADKEYERKSDVGIKINNILTSLVLAAILGGVGIVWDIKEQVSDIHTTTQVNHAMIEHNTKRIDQHQSNDKIHHKHQ